MIIYLYKKTHNVTGLKYLGKTTKKNPYRYTGSGKKWLLHIDKHGYDVTTEILKECKTKEEVKHWGKYYSDLWDIVDSKDANGKKSMGQFKTRRRRWRSNEKWDEKQTVLTRNTRKNNTGQYRKKTISRKPIEK